MGGVLDLAEVICILSGKGGTGKTALCAGIATVLSTSGKKVLCIDGDVGLRNLDIFLGMNGVETLSFQDVCSGNYTLAFAANHPLYPSLSFLTAPVNGSIEDIDEADFGAMIEKAKQQFDFILIDAPAGVGRGMKLCARFADRCILTALPDLASLRCANRTGQELEIMGANNVRMVVNRIFPEILKAMNMNIDDMMDAAGLPLLGVVPSDPNISFAAAKNLPLMKYSRFGAAAAYKRITKRILGMTVPISTR